MQNVFNLFVLEEEPEIILYTTGDRFWISQYTSYCNDICNLNTDFQTLSLLET